MATIAAANTFTDPVHAQADNAFDVSVSGTFVGTVAVQRTKDKTNGPWLTIDTFTAPFEKVGVSGSAWYYRVGFTAYTSGSAEMAIYK